MWWRTIMKGVMSRIEIGYFTRKFSRLHASWFQFYFFLQFIFLYSFFLSFTQRQILFNINQTTIDEKLKCVLGKWKWFSSWKYINLLKIHIKCVSNHICCIYNKIRLRKTEFYSEESDSKIVNNRRNGEYDEIIVKYYILNTFCWVN